LAHHAACKYGSVQNWNDIASLLTGRTNKDCRKRWSKIQVDIQKGVWTREEDERLQQAVQQLGFKYFNSGNVIFDRLLVLTSNQMVSGGHHGAVSQCRP
jgi:hypothetical protein